MKKRKEEKLTEVYECYCKICGRRLKTKKEYIDQNDTCNKCFNPQPINI